MLTRKDVLHLLPRSRLHALAQDIGLPSTAKCAKPLLVSRLCRSGSLGKLLSLLKLTELRTLSRRLEILHSGRRKCELVSAINAKVERPRIRAKITASIKSQGFDLCGSRISIPNPTNKDAIRTVHKMAVQHRIDKSQPGLAQHESRLLDRLANGSDVAPDCIRPRLTKVLRGSDDERLFRYVSLHWSIPVSSGYGRRLRFIVTDDHTGKLIGIIGLGDPVFSLAARDQWIGWGTDNRARRLCHVMDAFVLGAVPPYSDLLCGKLVAMLAVSDEVREAFRKQYQGTSSLIADKKSDGRLAMLTTTSALGRSSIYNRLRFDARQLYHSVGFTQGSGDFQFLNGLYDVLAEFAGYSCEPSAKQATWGSGFRNRREIVKKALSRVGLPANWLYHGVKREIFCVPLASNTKAFLKGEHQRLQWFGMPADGISDYFLSRWLLPRAARCDAYRIFDRHSWRLWP